MFVAWIDRLRFYRIFMRRFCGVCCVSLSDDDSNAGSEAKKGSAWVSGAPDDIADEMLVSRVQAGDKQAFACLVSRHGKRFRAIAIRVLADSGHAEEIVQEAFITLWTKPGSFDPARAKFTTWFHRVVVNRALDMKRRRRPEALPEGYDVADGRRGADETHNQAAQVAMMNSALAKLSERHRSALTLSYLDGYTNAQAADIMTLNIKAFESLLVRARQKMRDMLKGDKDDLLAAFE